MPIQGLAQFMPRKIIKRYLPDHQALREHKHLRWLGKWLHDPNLWHLNRNSVAVAMAVGLFVAFIPIPFQMVISAVFAVVVRGNLPIAVALVWITNPLTMLPIVYVAYKLGTWMLGMPVQEVSFEMSPSWFIDQFALVGKPVLVGSLAIGAGSSAAGYWATHWLWRLYILHHLRKRKQRPCNHTTSDNPPQ